MWCADIITQLRKARSRALNTIRFKNASVERFEWEKSSLNSVDMIKYLLWNQIKTHSDIIGVCHYGFAKVVVFKLHKNSYLDLLLVKNARIWLALSQFVQFENLFEQLQYICVNPFHYLLKGKVLL